MSDHPVFPLRLLPMSDDELEAEGSPDALAALVSRLANVTTPEILPELARALERLDDLDARDNPLVLMALGEAHCQSDGPRPDRAQGLSLLRVAADRGLAEAVSILCRLLDEGDAAEKAEAAERAADFRRELLDRDAGGDAEAPAYLWEFLHDGLGVERDPVAALAHLRVAAERGHVDAQMMLGCLLHSGDGGTKDSAEAVVWLRRAAEAGEPSAQFWLSLRLARGEGVEKDEAEAVHWERLAAERGCAFAQYALAERLRKKEGKPAEASVWYGRAAARGHENARLMYGRCYNEGWGVPQDKAEAFRHFVLAAEQGSAVASYNLGIFLQNGDGCVADRVAAVARYTAAAERGLALAQKKLGDALLGGDGVPADPAAAVRWYTAAAEAGNAAARNMLGRCYNEGWGVPQDKVEAVHHFTLAADAGDMQGAFSLAVALRSGDGCTKDLALAVFRLRAAADSGHAAAQKMLADCLLDGDGVPADPAEAVVWFAKAAEAGDTEARTTLGLCHLEGWGVPVDQAEAVRHLTPAADAGDPNAALHLAICLREGFGCAKNRAAAVPRLRAAATSGDATAQKLLADCLHRADGAPKDEAEAVIWYGKAADAGNADARNLLGRCHNEGWGVPKDTAEAVRHFTIAANAGHAAAAYNLALALRKGDGCAKDRAAAAPRLRAAAAAGHVSAQKLLADCLLAGDGVAKDPAEALAWYRKAADAGDVGACTALADCFARGHGVAASTQEAVRWHRAAAAKGHCDAAFRAGTLLHAGGKAKPEDLAAAAALFAQAADAGHAGAVNMLGRCHQEGWGVPKDLAAARGRFEAAAEASNHAGMLNYGLCLAYGWGGAVDPERAAYWLHRVAESDSPLRKQALEKLGVLHRDGAHGFVKSLHEAERLLRLAVAAGQASAAAHLKRTLDLKPAGAAAPAALPDAAARIAYDRRFDRLRAMTGLESVKEAVISLADAADVAIRRRQLGRVATLPTAHLVFTGNPGTGKTTVARIIGEIYRSIGLLRRGHVVEVDRAALVGKWLGETEDKTTEAIQRALDGILFIDEAYALTPEDPGRDFGPQAMEVILKAMEDHRGRLVVIAAGYAKEMQRFLDFNPGLRSRIANIVDFPDYEPQDLHTILHGFAGQEGMQLDELANQKVWRLIGQMHKNRAPGFGNAREMRNLFDTLRKRQASRLRTSAGNLDVIVAADVPDPAPEEVRKDPLRELDALIGLASVKTQVRTWGALVRQEAEMRRIGADQGEPMSNHMAFFGNPGTGKTTVARLIGGILADAGVLRRGHVVECSRADFVGAYQGQTAPKVRKKVEEALDGVLFLDEAYALVKDEQDTYGHEALAELVKCIEDHRDRLVLIVAGYKRETERLFAVNPGLPSRIGTVLTFEDYDASEMLRIFEKLCLDGRYELPLAAREKALAELKAMIDRKDPGFANGRSARNFYQVTIRNLALRRATSRGGPVNRIEAADIPTGMAF